MSTPAYLWLDDENGSPVVGSCVMPTRLGSIELKSFSHGVTIPVDPSWGKLTGTRVHSPITIIKEFDQTTPLLYRAVCEGRTMKKAQLGCIAFWILELSPSISISFLIMPKSSQYHLTSRQTA